MYADIWQLITLGGSIIGAGVACGWILIKIAATQYDKLLDTRFEAIKKSMDDEFKLIYERTKGSSEHAREISQLKLEFADYRTKVAENLSAKASKLELQAATDKQAEQFTRVAEKIESQIEKLFGIIDRKEDKKHSGQ